MSSSAAIARVEPLSTARSLQGPFDYRLGDQHADVEVGSLVRVPFSGRHTLGVVVELAPDSALAPERLSEPVAVLPSAVPRDLVALAGWMAQEYCSTPARALSLVLAPGAIAGAGPKRVLLADLTPAGRLALDGRAAPGNGTGPARPLTATQRRLLEALAAAGPTPASALGTPALRRLQKRGLVAIGPGELSRRPTRHSVSSAAASDPPLMPDQQRALTPVLQGIAAAAESHEGVSFLLHGVTGSGKTEIYLRAVRAALELGRSAIVLVPEIALTPQALSRFSARLGETVAVMHSGLGAGARHDEWLRLRRGQAQVCVGPRSAVFAPLRDLGLIIVDEEHESSYKHEGDPRYDARTVAAYRAKQHGAVLLVGSATPRPESVNTLPRLRLARRVDGHPLPPVRVLDMRGQHHPLHPEARSALADLRDAGGKGILLLNRRGWSNFLSCRSCGRVWMCPNCEVALVLHRQGNFVACHHCGHREPVPSRCPGCASVAVARHGAGTERLERELADALSAPGFPVLRLDADAAGLDARARALEAFAAAGAGILVGTQMVAKGHDFPHVRLGIVLDADATLRFPDFRAEERTFALITQLAGRAGRGSGGGEVLVQTTAPQARAIRYAADHDADGFLASELRLRELLRYPPFGSLIRIVCAAAEAADAHALAVQLQELVPPAAGAVLGPAPLFRLRGRHRFQLVIKAEDRAGAILAVAAAVRRLARKARRDGVSLSVDVDPQ